MMGGVIDWRTAERIAGFVAGAPPADLGLSRRLPRLAAESERRVVDYTGLTPAAPLPSPEAVNRQDWIAANLASMRPVLDPLSERVGEGLGVLSAPVRLTTGMLLAAQIGTLTGYLAQRVLGQFDLTILDPTGPTRLLFVEPNLEQATRSLEADRDELLTWVAFHEVTHAVQFTAVPWLRAHVASMVRSLLDSVEVSVDPSRLLKLPSSQDLRALVEAVRQGELITLVVGRERRDVIDRMQATMAVIEGYAEHVMDAVGADVLPSLGRLREALDRRRRLRHPVLKLLERLLGLELKMRQYEDGKRFCDAVVTEAGVQTLNRVWLSAENLPTPVELREPGTWIARVQVSAAA